jgi:hypothetical protein
MSPSILCPDGETWRAVTANCHPCHVLQHRLRPPDVYQELGLALRAGALMGVAMARQFMPTGNDGAHHVRVALGDPA